MNGIRHAVGRRTAIVGLANIRQPLSRGCRIDVGRVPDLADVEIAFKEVNRMFNEEECSNRGVTPGRPQTRAGLQACVGKESDRGAQCKVTQRQVDLFVNVTHYHTRVPYRTEERSRRLLPLAYRSRRPGALSLCWQ